MSGLSHTIKISRRELVLSLPASILSLLAPYGRAALADDTTTEGGFVRSGGEIQVGAIKFRVPDRVDAIFYGDQAIGPISEKEKARGLFKGTIFKRLC